MTADDADLLQEHLAACAAQLAWCIVPHQQPHGDLVLLARVMLSGAAAAFAVPTDELPSATQLLHEAQAQVVWRGEVDAWEREEWQAERIQAGWAELLAYRKLAEQK